jgi:hypothetical protein
MYRDLVHDFIVVTNQLFYNPFKSNKMKANTIVTADKAGNVISVSKNNPEWGHIRVEQRRMIIDENGFARGSRLSALIPGRVEELAAFNLSAGDVMPGAVYIKEQTIPFDAKQPERDLKVAGTTGVVCKLGADPIYRKNFYHSNPEKLDETIEHTNGQEILDAYNASKVSAIAPSEDFSL